MHVYFKDILIKLVLTSFVLSYTLILDMENNNERKVLSKSDKEAKRKANSFTKRDPLTQTKLQNFFATKSQESPIPSSDTEDEGGLVIDENMENVKPNHNDSTLKLNETDTSINEEDSDKTFKIDQAMEREDEPNTTKRTKTFVINITLQGIPNKSKDEKSSDVESKSNSSKDKIKTDTMDDKTKFTAKRKIKALFGESSDSEIESDDIKRCKISQDMFVNKKLSEDKSKISKSEKSKKRHKERKSSNSDTDREKMDTKHNKDRKSSQSDTDLEKIDKKHKQRNSSQSDTDREKIDKKHKDINSSQSDTDREKKDKKHKDRKISQSDTDREKTDKKHKDRKSSQSDTDREKTDKKHKHNKPQDSDRENSTKHKDRKSSQSDSDVVNTNTKHKDRKLLHSKRDRHKSSSRHKHRKTSENESSRDLEHNEGKNSQSDNDKPRNDRKYSDPQINSDDTLSLSESANTSADKIRCDDDKETSIENNYQNKLDSLDRNDRLGGKPLDKAYQLSLEAEKVLQALKQFSEIKPEPLVVESVIKDSEKNGDTNNSVETLKSPTKHGTIDNEKDKLLTFSSCTKSSDKHNKDLGKDHLINNTDKIKVDKDVSDKKEIRKDKKESSTHKEKRKEKNEKRREEDVKKRDRGKCKEKKTEKVDVAGLVVKLLMPYYKKKKINSRDLFKITARHIVHQLLAIQVTGKLKYSTKKS